MTRLPAGKLLASSHRHSRPHGKGKQQSAITRPKGRCRQATTWFNETVSPASGLHLAVFDHAARLSTDCVPSISILPLVVNQPAAQAIAECADSQPHTTRRSEGSPQYKSIRSRGYIPAPENSLGY